MQLESILAATDFSTDGRHAVERAGMICAAGGASRGAVLHVLEVSWLDMVRHFVSLPADVGQSMTAGAARSLDELVAAIRKRSGIDLEPMVREGKVIDTILEVSAGFSLLAIGARGKHPFRDFAVGTTAERLLRQTRKPVLVVRRNAAALYRRVLVAVDFSPHSRQALAYGEAIAPRGEIYLVHVFEPLFEGKMRLAGVNEEVLEEYRSMARLEAEEKMRQFIWDAGVEGRSLRPVVEHGEHVAGTLRNQARKIGADLVVVGKHGKSLAEWLLLGSVTLHLLMECSCDVLVTQ